MTPEPVWTTVRFSNESDGPIELMIEPWGTVELLEPGSNCAIHYPPPTDRPDTSHAEYHEGMIRFWCEGGPYELDIDGVRMVT